MKFGRALKNAGSNLTDLNQNRANLISKIRQKSENFDEILNAEFAKASGITQIKARQEFKIEQIVKF